MPKDSRSTPTTKATTSSRSLQQEAGWSGAIPTVTTPAASESNYPSYLTLTREQLVGMTQSIDANLDPALLLAQLEVASTPPAASQQNAPTFQTEVDNAPTEQEHSEKTVIIDDEVMVVTEMGEPLEEGEEVESTREPTVHTNGVLDTVRLIARGSEPGGMAEVPEETQSESIPMETSMMNEPNEEDEQPLLTPE